MRKDAVYIFSLKTFKLHQSPKPVPFDNSIQKE